MMTPQDMRDWQPINATEWIHARTGQRIKMLPHDFTEPLSSERMDEFERQVLVNGPGNGQDGRQA